MTEGEKADKKQRVDENATTGALHNTCMKAVAVVRRRLADSPVLASRFGQVCFKQCVNSARPSPRPVISWLSSSRSSFKEAWKT